MSPARPIGSGPRVVSLDDRRHPPRPILAVSSAIFDGPLVLVARRARPPAEGLFTCPGGVVEIGESLPEAAAREVREETGLEIDVVDLAGWREVIVRDDDERVERHFVIVCFAARLAGGTLALGDELAEARWIRPADAATLPTTSGLKDILERARAILGA